MEPKKRIFLIVLDSVGIGEMPDAADYGDEGSNTVYAASKSPYFKTPNLQKLGLFNIEGAKAENYAPVKETLGAVMRLKELSKGKDTTTGHWELAGIISGEPMPVFPEGFPQELLDELSSATGRKILCNKPYSGTEVIKDYGRQHEESGALIVYTSADSVLQIAAHEDVVPVEELYEICEKARRICAGKWGVGRVIARPFTGNYPEYVRTPRRHDYSLKPPRRTMLDILKNEGYTVAAVGKINDIFAGQGITEFVRTGSNAEGIDRTLEYMQKDFTGLCFTNLVDFDMLYGHRNDVDGYAKALTYFDERLPELMAAMREDDILMITADHGCDPSTPSTDHSREYVPLLMYGKKINANVNLETREGFMTVAATVLDYFGAERGVEGTSVLWMCED
ncbi:MAG: phosphopentomutase [Lachnospiraceae bacterium]|nr:phosphopentomutase [Lachnospiraceae bacterium]